MHCQNIDVKLLLLHHVHPFAFGLEAFLPSSADGMTVSLAYASTKCCSGTRSQVAGK